MSSIRRSGGMVMFFWDGKLPAPDSDEFVRALSQRRFRSIENAASEEVSIGWVTKGDPTGDGFASEDLDAGPGTWLRLRIDKKKLPIKWLGIHRDVAEKQRGRKLSAKERKELKDGLYDSLLPRVLPTVNFIDALLFAERSMVLLFATGTGVCEAFARLFFETFTIPVDRADPFLLGLRCGLGDEHDRALEQAQPVRWPSERLARRPQRVAGPVQTAAAEEAEA
jgi:hypothetical protein